MRATELRPILAALAVLAVLSLVLPIRPPAAGAESSIAECLTLADAPSSDLTALERCHRLVPADLELAADLGAAYEAAQRPEAAIAIYTQIVERDPHYAEIRLRLASLLNARGDAIRAKAQVDEALRIQPNRRELAEFDTGTR